jgi:hypothetical protein
MQSDLKLKNCQRVTFSLPKELVGRFMMAVPKSHRSKFIGEWIRIGLREMNINSKKHDSNGVDFWADFRKRNPSKVTTDSLCLIRNDRASH